MKTLWITLIALCFCISNAFGQYNSNAGENVVVEPARSLETGQILKDKNGNVKYKKVKSDTYGNAAGNQYDLAVDGAFKGQTVAVLHLYTGEGFNFELPKAALKEKGFSTYRWINNPPEPKELEEKLKKSCQLWIISDRTQKLNDHHLKVIKKYFESGKGVYIWGDNDPYYADANYVAKALIGTTMLGNLPGNKTVPVDYEKEKMGLTPGHLITTGLEYVYEGITIATIQDSKHLSPLIYGSQNNLVTAVYEQDGKRLLLDGGFTRLFINWDTAGTARYVKNAAAWLVNFERFGDQVLPNAEEK